jgi:periplasmic copper chaperone A
MKMSTVFQSLITAIALCLATTASAHAFQKGNIHIEHPYARATLPGQPVGGGYMKLMNQGTRKDRLLWAKSHIGKRTELHSMHMQGDVMHMQAVPHIELPPGETIELKPGALHIMFMELKAPLKIGKQFPMTLNFEHAGTVRVMVEVQAVQP